MKYIWNTSTNFTIKPCTTLRGKTYYMYIICSCYYITYVYIQVFVVSFKTVSDLWSTQASITGLTPVVGLSRQTSSRFYTVPFTHYTRLICWSLNLNHRMSRLVTCWQDRSIRGGSDVCSFMLFPEAQWPRFSRSRVRSCNIKCLLISQTLWKKYTCPCFSNIRSVGIGNVAHTRYRRYSSVHV